MTKYAIFPLIGGKEIVVWPLLHSNHIPDVGVCSDMAPIKWILLLLQPHHDPSGFGSEQKQWAHLIASQLKNGNL